MSRSPSPKPEAQPVVKPAAAYHHGDLRQALIGAAREALETATPETITLKSLAVRLGVSQPAPYRHFENREALLAAVTADGFARFNRALAEATAGLPPEARFGASALAYLAFGRANRGVYRLMFASRMLPTSHDAALQDVSAAAFGNLVAAVGTHVPPERALPLAIWVWSTLHGLVMLESEGMVAGPTNGAVDAAGVVHEMVTTLQGPRKA